MFTVCYEGYIMLYEFNNLDVCYYTMCRVKMLYHIILYTIRKSNYYVTFSVVKHGLLI
jgi:hypothetical protein